MQKFGKTLITNAGRQMLTDVDGAKGKLTYTKAAIYTQNVNSLKEVDIIALTSLTGSQLETDLQVTDVKDNSVTVLASFNNAKVTKDLTFNSIGWFAKTSVDDQEQLMAVTPSETEQTLVAGSKGASTSSIDVEMVFARSHDTTVVVNPSSVGLVSAAQMDGAIGNAKESIVNGINQLSALAEPSNMIDSKKIDLDSFVNKGITKFTNCQLQSTGRMVGLNKDATNLSGWIFNVLNVKGEPPYQQLVYVYDYGSGTQAYLRTRRDPFSTKQDDFEKLTTDRDMAKLLNLTQDGVYKAFRSTTINPNDITETGIYRLSSCALTVKATSSDLTSRYWGWLINLNYENTATSNAIYQILIVNEVVYYRVISAQYSKYPDFDNLAFGSDVAKLQQAINNVDFSSLETKVDAKAAHDSLTTAIAKRVLSVNEKAADASGNVVLTDFDHPTQVFNGTTVNFNTLTATGLYELRNATIQNSLSSLPGFTQLNATYAYLIAINNPSLNNTFQILICRQLKNFVLDYRYINKTYNDFPDFKRIIDSSDYTNLFNKIDSVDKKELVHHCDDLDSGVAYSKANPNVFVATP